MTISFYVGPQDAAASGDADFSASYSKHVAMGIEYTKEDGFRKIRELDGPGFQHTGPTFTYQGQAHLLGTLVPELKAEIYGVWPIKLRPKIYVGIDLKVGAGSGCKSMLSPHYVGFSLSSFT